MGWSYPSNLLPERGIEWGSSGYDLRKTSSSREFPAKSGAGPHIGDPMKSLRPPFIPLDPQPRDCCRIVHEQTDLLGQCEPSDQILHPIRDWQRLAAEGEALGVADAGKRRPRMGWRRRGEKEEVEEEGERKEGEFCHFRKEKVFGREVDVERKRKGELYKYKEECRCRWWSECNDEKWGHEVLGDWILTLGFEGPQRKGYKWCFGCSTSEGKLKGRLGFKPMKMVGDYFHLKLLRSCPEKFSESPFQWFLGFGTKWCVLYRHRYSYMGVLLGIGKVWWSNRLACGPVDGWLGLFAFMFLLILQKKVSLMTRVCPWYIIRQDYWIFSVHINKIDMCM